MHATRRWARRAAGATLVAVLALVLCALGAVAFLGTQTGRDAAARLAARVLSDGEVTVRIDGIGGNLLSDFRIDLVSVTDGAGNTVRIEDTRIAWRPVALLRGTLDIRVLRSRRIATDGFPDMGGAEAGSVSLPPLSIQVVEAAVEEIALGAAILGAPQRLALTAAAALDSSLRRMRLGASLVRIDDAGHAELGLDYAAQPARLVVRLDIEEPAGGPIGWLAGLPPGTPLSVKLDGAGPPDRWRGTLAARAGNFGDLQADVVLAAVENKLTLSLDGDTALAALLPQAAQPFATPRIAVHAALELGQDGDISLTKLDATSAALSVAAQGRYSPSGAVEGSLSATLRDEAALAAIAPGLSLDDARLDATLGGTTSRPTLDGRIRSRGLAAGTVKAAGLNGELHLAPASGDALALSGAFRLEGLEAPASLPDGLLGPALTLRIEAELRSDGTLPRLDLAAQSGAAAAEIAAAVDTGGRVEGRYALRHADITGAAQAAGLPLHTGALQMAGGLRADLASGEARLEISGDFNELAAEETWLTALLGSRVALAGALHWDGVDRLRLTGLDAGSAAARLRGDMTIDPYASRVDARYDVSMASLESLSPLAGVPLAGSIAASGTIAGPAATPRIGGQLTIRDIDVQGVAVGTVTAEIDAQRADSGLAAALRLGGEIGGRALGGAVELAFAGANMRVPRIDVSVGRDRLAGELAVSGGARVIGSLTATLADFADLPAMAGLPPFRGHGTVKLHLRDAGAQEVVIDVDAAGVAAGDTPAKARRLTANIIVRDPFRTVSVDGRIDLAGVNVEAVSLDSARITGAGTLSALDWTASASAAQPEPLSLAAAGRLALDDGGGAVTVTRLDGAAAAHRIALRAPATVAWSAGGAKLDLPDLAVGGGGFRLAGTMGTDTIDASGETTRLPAALAALLNPQLAFAGTVSGRVNISGAAARPQVEVTLTGTGIRPLDLAAENFAGLEMTAELRQNRDELRVRLAAVGPQETTATAELRTAAALSLAPLRLAPPADAPLAGRIEAGGKLDLVERYIGLAGDRLAGRVTANAILSGTVARPELRGDAALTGGAYEGVATGIVMRDAAARIEFTGSEARLVSLSARDGNGGRVSGSGALAFAGQPAGTGRISIVLDRFAALRRPEAEIVASGTLALTGPIHAPAVEGRLSVERGELRIPDRLPPGIVELDVIEINGPEESSPGRDRPDPAISRTVPVALDVAVDVPGRTFLRGRGLDSEWQGALRIGGTGAAPAITGSLSVVRGTFAFAGRSFALKSGRVAFDGSETLEPEIEAVAEARLDSVLARVGISGKTSAPVLTISSEPPLPQEDVLAQILFGQSTGQLSALQAARLAQTAATLSGSGSGIDILGRVRQAIGVDVLDVGEGDSGGATLKAGKYLTDDVFVSVTQGTEPGSQRVGVEVEILPNLSVESDISGEASSNIGVNWKFDY